GGKQKEGEDGSTQHARRFYREIPAPRYDGCRMTDLHGALASPEAKAAYVRRLFATIADRYDLITVLLSFGRDRRWKDRLVRLARVVPGTRALDLACGTG